MSRQFLAAAGVMLAICPVAASAEDPAGPGSPESASTDAPAPVSTGFRVEGVIGYDAAAFDSFSRGDGLLYGLGAGYDLAVGRMRFGVEAEVTESTARDCFALAGLPGNACFRASRDLYAGARIGVVVDRGVLVYGKVGYTNFLENVSIPFAGGIAVNPDFDGLRLGLGAEIAISRRTYVKVEYRYSNYEWSQDFDRNQGVVGFGLRF